MTTTSPKQIVNNKIALPYILLPYANKYINEFQIKKKNMFVHFPML